VRAKLLDENSQQRLTFLQLSARVVETKTMEQVVPLPESKNDQDIHKICMYGHIQELRKLLGVPDPNAPKDSPKGSDNEEDPTSPQGSDDELDGGDSAVSPPNSPGMSPSGSPLNSPGRGESLVLEGLDSLSATGQTALSLAAEEGHLNCLNLLLDLGADVSIPCSGGMQALHSAANTYKEACVKVLIEKGADVNAKTDTGLTPTYFSVCRGVLACLKLLVSAGGDIEYKTAQGGSLIHVAVINGNVGLLRYLTEVSLLCLYLLCSIVFCCSVVLFFWILTHTSYRYCTIAGP
jgi:hypothetical protein